MDKELFLPLAFLGVVLLIIVIILVKVLATKIMSRPRGRDFRVSGRERGRGVAFTNGAHTLE